MPYTPWPASPPVAGDGEGVSVHNLLSGRSTADAHPTSAITGLDDALAAAAPPTFQYVAHFTPGTLGEAADFVVAGAFSATVPDGITLVADHEVMLTGTSNDADGAYLVTGVVGDVASFAWADVQPLAMEYRTRTVGFQYDAVTQTRGASLYMVKGVGATDNVLEAIAGAAVTRSFPVAMRITGTRSAQDLADAFGWAAVPTTGFYIDNDNSLIYVDKTHQTVTPWELRPGDLLALTTTIDTTNLPPAATHGAQWLAVNDDLSFATYSFGANYVSANSAAWTGLLDGLGPGWVNLDTILARIDADAINDEGAQTLIDSSTEGLASNESLGVERLRSQSYIENYPIDARCFRFDGIQSDGLGGWENTSYKRAAGIGNIPDGIDIRIDAIVRPPTETQMIDSVSKFMEVVTIVDVGMGGGDRMELAFHLVTVEDTGDPGWFEDEIGHPVEVGDIVVFWEHVPIGAITETSYHADCGVQFQNRVKLRVVLDTAAGEVRFYRGVLGAADTTVTQGLHRSWRHMRTLSNAAAGSIVDMSGWALDVGLRFKGDLFSVEMFHGDDGDPIDTVLPTDCDPGETSFTSTGGGSWALDGDHADVVLPGSVDAADVPYTPAAPSNWTVEPDDVKEALDTLAGTQASLTYWPVSVITAAGASAGHRDGVVMNAAEPGTIFLDAGGGGDVVLVKRHPDMADTVTVTPDGSETIDGAASLSLAQGEGVVLVFTDDGDGPGWYVFASTA